MYIIVLTLFKKSSYQLFILKKIISHVRKHEYQFSLTQVMNHQFLDPHFFAGEEIHTKFKVELVQKIIS